MDRDEAMRAATLKGQKTRALENARGIAHKMIVEDWAEHTKLPDHQKSRTRHSIPSSRQ